jgi:hypothetical protein
MVLQQFAQSPKYLSWISSTTLKLTCIVCVMRTVAIMHYVESWVRYCSFYLCLMPSVKSMLHYLKAHDLDSTKNRWISFMKCVHIFWDTLYSNIFRLCHLWHWTTGSASENEMASCSRLKLFSSLPCSVTHSSRYSLFLGNQRSHQHVCKTYLTLDCLERAHFN